MLVNRLLPFHANQSVLITSCSSRSVFSVAKRSAFLFSLLPYWFSHDYAANRSLRSIAQLLLLQKSTPCFLTDSLKLLPFHIHSFTVVRLTFSRIICLNSSLPHCSVSSSVKISNLSLLNLWFTLLVRVRFVLHPPCFPSATRMISFLVVHVLLR